MRFWETQRVVVTGEAGVVGSFVVERLRARVRTSLRAAQQEVRPAKTIEWYEQNVRP